MTRFPAPRRWPLWALGAPAAAFAQAEVPPDPVRLPPVVVTATRTEATGFDVPASIDRVDGTDVRAEAAHRELHVLRVVLAIARLQSRHGAEALRDVDAGAAGAHVGAVDAVDGRGHVEAGGVGAGGRDDHGGQADGVGRHLGLGECGGGRAERPQRPAPRKAVLNEETTT